MLSKKEFDVLLLLYKKETNLTQREISYATGYSLGSTNKTLTNLRAKKLLTEQYLPTTAGVNTLLNYKVDNAIIMAAGMSSRFAPISYERPKGLLRVKGEILIERQIRQLQEAGINNITIVVGYMKEQFFYLQKKFGVSLVVNEDYYRYNNTSTLMTVLNFLNNTYICSSDNYFVDNVFNEFEYSSYYSTTYSHGSTNEWCVKTDNKNTIVDVSIGGTNSLYMIGHVYWDKSFSKKFVSILKHDYLKESTKHMLWEEIYIQHIKDLPLHIKEFSPGTILEFDSLDDLRQFDMYYLENTNSKILKNICTALNCKESEVSNISTLKNGPSGITFKFKYHESMYLYRHPHIHSDEYTNYKHEYEIMSSVKSLGLYNEIVYIHPTEFWKISYFTDTTTCFSYDNEKQVIYTLDFMKKLHSSQQTCTSTFDLWESNENMIALLKQTGRLNFSGFDELYDGMNKLNQIIKSDKIPVTLCNNNLYDDNISFDNNNNIIVNDWKYSGIGDPYLDLGTFICCSNYNHEQVMHILDEYHNYTMTDFQKRHALACIALSSYHWYLWAIYQDYCGTPIGNNIYKWFTLATEYYNIVSETYYQNKDQIKG